jgi:inosine-uridine nucleoside N-ribohydrolase
LVVSPEIDLLGVTTVSGDTRVQAVMVCRFLHLVGRSDVPVAVGKGGGAVVPTDDLHQYGRRPAFRKSPVKEPAVEFLYQKLKARPGEITLFCAGPLTNIAELVDKHPDCKPWIKRIIVAPGIRLVAEKPGEAARLNTVAVGDPAAAKSVYASGLPLVLVPAEFVPAVRGKTLAALRHQILNAGTLPVEQLHALSQLATAQAVSDVPSLVHMTAVALCCERSGVTTAEAHVHLSESGVPRLVLGAANCRIVSPITAAEDLAAMQNWYAQRLGGSPQARSMLPVLNHSKLVPRGGLPNRVAVFEDFRTDIERRWWLAGKFETQEAPPGSDGRAGRGVLTNDFDDRQGDPKLTFTAVIFNPVPGPPMGPNTRLAFRYRLKGTDKLRVQIYSLSNGYHRCLTLTDLPQGEWHDGTVDMTQLRRPDGTGGPLSENERIDDIQFYADAAAELLIDDIVLYDAAPADEREPFPARFLFTGGFDTGAKGREWPGDFDLVAKEKPYTFRAAKSVMNPATNAPWIRVGLRGPRPLPATVRVRLRCKLTGAESFRIECTTMAGKQTFTLEARGLRTGEWAEFRGDFLDDAKRPAGSPSIVADAIDEVRFLLPAGAELLIDDLLLFEPGK